VRFPIDFLESYGPEDIISELRRIANETGKTTLTRKDIDRHGRISSGVVIRRFGSLRKAHQEAKLNPSRFMKATNDELYGMLIDLWTITLEKFGRSPFRNELRPFGFPVSGDTYVRRFGTWNKALLAAANSVSEQAERPERLSDARVQEGPAEKRSLSVRKRFIVFKRDRYKCRICSRSGVPLEVDHILPRQQGGSDRLDNLQTLCFDCNRGKRNSLQ